MISRSHATAVLATIFTMVVSSLPGQTARFDAPGLVEGREVSPAEFQSLHPREKLVEFALEISADLGVAGHENVSALSLRCYTLESDVTIVDYYPRTVLDSDVDGTIAVETVDESSSSLGLQANSGASMPWNANATAGVGGKNAQSLRYQKKPEQQLSVSSGIWDRGTGLFIKIRKTSQQPLEGTHAIRLTLRMPIEWRTGYLRLECDAASRKDSRLSESTYSLVGRRVFLIPLLIEGDEQARVLAGGIHHAESVLSAAAQANTARAKPDNLWAEISRWSQSEKTPRLGAVWLEQVTTSVSLAPTAIDSSLPKNVSIALKDYSNRRQKYGELKQPRPTENIVSQMTPGSTIDPR